jgi:hypothetical protein
MDGSLSAAQGRSQGEIMPTPRPITLEGLDGFSIDESNQPYWHGKKVRTSLPECITLLAWAVGLATAAAALVDKT